MKTKNYLSIFLIGLILICFRGELFAQINIVYSSKCAPALLNFSNARSAAKTYFWEFPNANISTLAKPEIYFTSKAPLMVICRSWDSLGNNFIDTARFQLYENPKASFSANVLSGCPNTEVTFNSTSQKGNASIVSYFWVFGNGETSIVKVPKVKYDQSGNYTPSLFITDSLGCKASAQILNYIEVFYAPEVNFDAIDNYHCTAPHAVSFINKTTGNAPLTYLWSFGDGKSSTAVNTSNNYLSKGRYDVTLEVKDNNGCISKKTVKDAAYLGKLNVDFRTSGVQFCNPDNIQFTNLTNPKSDSLNYTWKIGAQVFKGQNISPFLNKGTYDVALYIDKNGCKDSLVKKKWLDIDSLEIGNMVLSDTFLCYQQNIMAWYDKPINAAYKWMLNGKIISNKDTLSYFVNEFDSFKLELSLAKNNGCKINLAPQTFYHLPPRLNISKGVQCVNEKTIIEISNLSFYPLTSKSYFFSHDSVVVYPPKIEKIERIFKDTIAYELNYLVSDAHCTNEYLVYINPGYRLKPTAIGVSDTFLCPQDTLVLSDESNKGLIPKHGKSWGVGVSFQTNPVFKMKDKLDSLDVHLIYNHFSCQDTFTSYKRVYGFPLTGSISIKDSCSAYQRLQPFIDFNRANYYEITYPNDTTFVNINPKYTAKPGINIFEYTLSNDTFGCIYEHSYSKQIYDSIGAVLKITKDTICAPSKISLTLIKADDLKRRTWVVNGEEQWVDNKTPFENKRNITIKQAGKTPVSILLQAHDGCFKTIEDYIEVLGPSANPSIVFLDSCLPARAIFTDSAFNTDYVRFWVSGADTFIQKNVTTNGIIKSLGEIKSSPVLSYHVKDNKGCSFQETFNYEGKKFYADVEMEIFNTCSYPKYRLLLFVSNFTFESIKWTFDDSIVTTGSRWGNIQYMSPGVHKYKVEWMDRQGCLNALSNTITVPEKNLKVDFEPLISALHCAPKLFQFINKSNSKNGVKSYLWDFGGVEKAIVANPQWFVQQPNSYGVKLIVEDSIGCRDSIFKPGVIALTAPKIDFVLEDSLGCAPFNAAFNLNINKKDKIFLYPNDGAKLEVKQSGNVNYQYLFAGNYKPYITLTDSFYCTIDQSLDYNLRVLERPKANFNNSPFCADMGVEILNESEFISSNLKTTQWLSPIASEEKNLRLKLPAGTYMAKLMVENNNGCWDTIEKTLNVYGFYPKVKLRDTLLCQSDTNLVEVAFNRDTGLINYYWSVNNSQLFGIPLKLSNISAGKHLVSFSAQNSLSCWFYSDTFQFIVAGNEAKKEPLINYITAVENDVILFEHNRVLSNDFLSYRYLINHPENNYWEYNFNNNLDKNAIKKFPLPFLNNKSYCVWVDYNNACSTEMDTSLLYKHCTIALKAMADTLRAHLSWTKYIGAMVTDYLVYRKETNAQNWSLIAQLPETLLNYMDTGFNCAANVQYKVEAALVGNYFSSSNIETVKVLNSLNKEVLTIENVSILDHAVEITIQASALTKIIQLNALTQKSLYRLIPNQVFKDSLANLDMVNYYVVNAINLCNLVGVPSAIANSILLTSQKVENNYHLKWNKPMHWETNYSGFALQQQNANNHFETVAYMHPSDSNFIYQLFPQTCAGNLINIRIGALKLVNSDTVYAFSNLIEISPKSILFVPNAFSPNGDKINDVFQPKGTYIKEYKLIVYNRWGEQVFESKSCMEGWDGTYSNNKCQEGVYSYLIFAKGIDGQMHNYKGQLTLLH